MFLSSFSFDETRFFIRNVTCVFRPFAILKVDQATHRCTIGQALASQGKRVLDTHLGFGIHLQ